MAGPTRFVGLALGSLTKFLLTCKAFMSHESGFQRLFFTDRKRHKSDLQISELVAPDKPFKPTDC